MEQAYESLFIGGQWRKPVGTNRIEVTSASTEEVLGSVPEAAEGDIDLAVAAAREAFTGPAGWGSWSPARRGEALERLAIALEKRSEQFAQLVSSQNGMPISIGRISEAVSGQLLVRYFSGLAQQQQLKSIYIP
jgi:aldehyde dehydrogenase (NAD+)